MPVDGATAAADADVTDVPNKKSLGFINDKSVVFDETSDMVLLR